MIDYALDCDTHPVFVRTPGGPVIDSDLPVDPDFSKYQIVEQGEKIALIGAGTFLQTALQAAKLMKATGMKPTVINPRILSTLDTATLDTLRDYDHVITLEDGILDGGFGQKVAAYLGSDPVKVTCLGLKKEFLDRYDARTVLEANGLTPAQVAALA